MGLDNRTDEHIIGTRYGVYRAATIKAVPEDKRWDTLEVLAVAGTPWDPTANVDAEDAARLPDPNAGDGEVVPRDPEVPIAVARRMYIKPNQKSTPGGLPAPPGPPQPRREGPEGRSALV